MKYRIASAVLLTVLAACSLEHEASPDGRERVARMDGWIATRAVDSVRAATSEAATVVRPGLGTLRGEAAIQVLLFDSTVARWNQDVVETNTGLVETGSLRYGGGPEFQFTRVWLVDDSEWKLAHDVTTVTTGEDSARGRDPAPSTSPDVSVGDGQDTRSEANADRIVAAVRAGDRTILESVEQVAAACRDPEVWTPEVFNGLAEVAPHEMQPDYLVRLAPLVARTRLCRGTNVDDWLQAAIRIPLDLTYYQELLDRTGVWFWYEELQEEDALTPDHKAIATESVLRGMEGAQFTNHAPALGGHFSAFGLSEPYLEKWLPFFLRDARTRESTVLSLAPEVAAHPDARGAERAVVILGSQVAAFPERFSEEARRALESALESLKERDDLPSTMTRGLEDVAQLRSQGRNYLGAVVGTRDAGWTFVDSDGRCETQLSDEVQRAIEGAVPGFTPEGGVACTYIRAEADFDGDASTDLAVLGRGPEGRAVVAVLNRESPEAFHVEDVGEGWISVYLWEPLVLGTQPGCYDIQPHRTPVATDMIAISYDEEFSTGHPFLDGDFQRFEGSGC